MNNSAVAPVVCEHRREELQDPPLDFMVLLIPRALQQPRSTKPVRAANLYHLLAVQSFQSADKHIAAV